jgi:hypothetical protein
VSQWRVLIFKMCSLTKLTLHMVLAVCDSFFFSIRCNCWHYNTQNCSQMFTSHPYPYIPFILSLLKEMYVRVCMWKEKLITSSFQSLWDCCIWNNVTVLKNRHTSQNLTYFLAPYYSEVNQFWLKIIWSLLKRQERTHHFCAFLKCISHLQNFYVVC